MPTSISPNTPAMTPPPGVIPNFDNPPSQDAAIIALEAVFVPLMVLAVLARAWVRLRIVKIWGLEDTTCILAAAGSLAHLAVYTKNLPLGLGKHLWDVRAITLMDPETDRVLSANGITYPWTIAFAKISILLYYKRLFGVKRNLRMLVWAGIVFNAFFYTGYAAVGVGEISVCVGLAQLQNPFCVFGAGILVVIVSFINFLTDVYILILPIKHVLNLQMKRGRKIGLLVVFGSGVLACAASLARLLNFSLNAKSGDIFWVQGANACFTIVEMNIAIIVGCVSTLPPFFARARSLSLSLYHSIVPRLRRSRKSGSAGSSTEGKKMPSSGHSNSNTAVTDLHLPIMNFSTRRASMSDGTRTLANDYGSEHSVTKNEKSAIEKEPYEKEVDEKSLPALPADAGIECVTDYSVEWEPKARLSGPHTDSV